MHVNPTLSHTIHTLYDMMKHFDIFLHMFVDFHVLSYIPYITYIRCFGVQR